MTTISLRFAKFFISRYFRRIVSKIYRVHIDLKRWNLAIFYIFPSPIISFRGWTLFESELFSSVKYSCASSKVSSALLPKSPPILAFLFKDRGYPYRSFRNRCWRFVKFEALFRKYFEQQLRKRRKFLEYTKRVEY